MSSFVTSSVPDPKRTLSGNTVIFRRCRRHRQYPDLHADWGAGRKELSSVPRCHHTGSCDGLDRPPACRSVSDALWRRHGRSGGLRGPRLCHAGTARQIERKQRPSRFLVPGTTTHGSCTRTRNATELSDLPRRGRGRERSDAGVFAAGHGRIACRTGTRHRCQDEARFRKYITRSRARASIPKRWPRIWRASSPSSLAPEADFLHGLQQVAEESRDSDGARKAQTLTLRR